MAENFNNYLTKKSYSTGGTQIIIPAAEEAISSSVGAGERGASTISQVHSIYITKIITSDQSSDPIGNAAVVSISVRDNATDYYIAKNVKVLPHSSFYIEKTITLRPQDCIRLTYHGSSSAGIDAVCSGIDLT